MIGSAFNRGFLYQRFATNRHNEPTAIKALWNSYYLSRGHELKKAAFPKRSKPNKTSQCKGSLSFHASNLVRIQIYLSHRKAVYKTSDAKLSLRLDLIKYLSLAHSKLSSHGWGISVMDSGGDRLSLILYHRGLSITVAPDQH